MVLVGSIFVRVLRHADRTMDIISCTMNDPDNPYIRFSNVSDAQHFGEGVEMIAIKQLKDREIALFPRKGKTSPLSNAEYFTRPPSLHNLCFLYQCGVEIYPPTSFGPKPEEQMPNEGSVLRYFINSLGVISHHQRGNVDLFLIRFRAKNDHHTFANKTRQMNIRKRKKERKKLA
ncbi:unnamed protein product [Dovyalis caffra]|uniref:Uncharacterized protein n=1 Tax=Dovyalis caffra TaxID=77055 RepID=A0AAV1SEK6_9ROSI|nr:unnamed protein product [Dovyalis caffra]